MSSESNIQQVLHESFQLRVSNDGINAAFPKAWVATHWWAMRSCVVESQAEPSCLPLGLCGSKLDPF